jgi:uncharacterized protein YbcI
MGRGPVEAGTYIIQDIVIIRLKGILTPAETHLAKDDEGIHLIKQIRAKLLEKSRGLLEDMITDYLEWIAWNFLNGFKRRNLMP